MDITKLGGDFVQKEPFSTPNEKEQRPKIIRYMDTAKQRYYLPIEKCQTWFELLETIGRESFPISHNMFEESKGYGYELLFGDEQITDKSWATLLLSEKSVQISLSLHWKTPIEESEEVPIISIFSDSEEQDDQISHQVFIDTRPKDPYTSSHVGSTAEMIIRRVPSKGHVRTPIASTSSSVMSSKRVPEHTPLLLKAPRAAQENGIQDITEKSNKKKMQPTVEDENEPAIRVAPKKQVSFVEDNHSSSSEPKIIERRHRRSQNDNESSSGGGLEVPSFETSMPRSRDTKVDTQKHITSNRPSDPLKVRPILNTRRPSLDTKNQEPKSPGLDRGRQRTSVKPRARSRKSSSHFHSQSERVRSMSRHDQAPSRQSLLERKEKEDETDRQIREEIRVLETEKKELIIRKELERLGLEKELQEHIRGRAMTEESRWKEETEKLTKQIERTPQKDQKDMDEQSRALQSQGSTELWVDSIITNEETNRIKREESRKQQQMPGSPLFNNEALLLSPSGESVRPSLSPQRERSPLSILSQVGTALGGSQQPLQLLPHSPRGESSDPPPPADTQSSLPSLNTLPLPKSPPLDRNSSSSPPQPYAHSIKNPLQPAEDSRRPIFTRMSKQDISLETLDHFKIEFYTEPVSDIHNFLSPSNVYRKLLLERHELRHYPKICTP